MLSLLSMTKSVDFSVPHFWYYAPSTKRASGIRTQSASTSASSRTKKEGTSTAVSVPENITFTQVAAPSTTRGDVMSADRGDVGAKDVVSDTCGRADSIVKGATVADTQPSSRPR